MRTLTIIAIVLFGISAQASDQRPFKIIHQFTPSNFYGVAFNRFTEPLATALKRPVIFENQVGGNGIVAVHKYQTINDDKTFIVLNANTFTIMPLFQKVSYKPDELEPMALIGMSTMCYATKSDSKETDFLRFIAANKGKFYGTLSGISAEEILINYINKNESLGLTPISYRTYPDLTQGLLRGDIQWSIIPTRSCGMSPTDGGLIELKNVPDKYDIDYWFGNNWFGLFGKKNADKKIRDEFTNIFIDTWWKNKDILSKTVQYPTRDIRNEDFKRYIESYGKKWESLAKKQHD